MGFRRFLSAMAQISSAEPNLCQDVSTCMDSEPHPKIRVGFDFRNESCGQIENASNPPSTTAKAPVTNDEASLMR